MRGLRRFPLGIMGGTGHPPLTKHGPPPIDEARVISRLIVLVSWLGLALSMVYCTVRVRARCCAHVRVCVSLDPHAKACGRPCSKHVQLAYMPTGRVARSQLPVLNVRGTHA